MGSVVNAMPWLWKKTQYLYSWLGGPQGQPGQVQKISPPPGFNPWTIRSVMSCYTDYANQAQITQYFINFLAADFNDLHNTGLIYQGTNFITHFCQSVCINSVLYTINQHVNSNSVIHL